VKCFFARANTVAPSGEREQTFSTQKCWWRCSYSI